MKVSFLNRGDVPESLYRYLDTNGDGTGTKNAIGNYASAEEIFYIQPPSGVCYRLNRILIHIEDSGSFDSGSYGNGITLTNGITMRVQDDVEEICSLTDGVPVKKNTHWSRLCYDAQPSNYGAGAETLNVRWTFEKAGYPLRLQGNNNERLEVVLNDDFSGLAGHYFLVEGYIEPK